MVEWGTRETAASDAQPRVPIEAVVAFASVTDTPILVVAADTPDITTAQARVQWLNAAGSDLLATDLRSLVGRALAEIHGITCVATDRLRATRTTVVTLVVTPPGQTSRTLRGQAVPAGPGTWVVTVADDAAARTAAAELASSEARFRVLIEKMPVATGFSDVGLRLSYVNDRMAELFEAPARTLIGTGWLDAVADADRDAFEAALVDVLHGRPLDRVIDLAVDSGQRRVHARITPVPFDRQSVRFVAAFDDVTESTRVANQLTWQANHDQLTGLPNRTSLLDLLREETSAHRPLAVAFVDLDNFKYVNDSLGHRAGDQLLIEVANRLRQSCRDSDRTFRLAGDEFVVIALGLTEEDQAAAMARRITETLFTSTEVEGARVEVSGSVGVVLSVPGDTAETLLRNADVAMYQAKGAGGNRYALFDQAVQEQLSLRMRLATDLRSALAAGIPDVPPPGSPRRGLDLAFQPIVSTATGRLVGVESLLRWFHDEVGPVPAPELVAIAEAHRLGEALARWVLRRSLAGLDRIRAGVAERDRPGYITMNMTAGQVASPQIVADLLDSLDSGRAAGDICLELTESALLTAPAVLDHLTQLRDCGLRVAIDDFGTGYSSLAYLSRLPITALKADQSFVAELADAPAEATTRSIVGVLVSLAAAFELDLIAEGVEDATVADRVASLGCPSAQGFHYGPPMSESELVTWAAARP